MLFQIQSEKRQWRQRQRRLPFVQHEVKSSPEAVGCQILENSFLPNVNKGFNILENKTIAMHLALEEFIPAMRMGLSSFGLVDPRTAKKILSSKPKFMDALKVIFNIIHDVSILIRIPEVSFECIFALHSCFAEHPGYHCHHF